MDFLQIIQSISIIIASVVAVYGINAWRRELKGKREIELAEEVLALFYEARELIAYIRNPGGYVSEGESRKKGLYETEEQTKILNSTYVVFERYEKVSEKFNKLFALKYRFMAIFGKNSAKPFDDIYSIRNKIFSAARRLSYYKMRIERHQLKEEDYDRLIMKIDQNEAIFWEEMIDPDPIKEEINKIIFNVEEICSKIIKTKY